MAPIAQDSSPTSVIGAGGSDKGKGTVAGHEMEVEVGYHSPDRKGKGGSRAGTPPPPAPVEVETGASSGSSAPSTPVASGRTPTTKQSAAAIPPQPDLLAEALEELEEHSQASTPDPATTLSSLGSGDMTEREVPYSSGATNLFLAIEQCRWDDAVSICRERPEQAKTWVKSSGSDKTSFDWNIWKRLPIHEACRRQPPPILISALLDAFPTSCAAKTHFGELPLHLAIGCGSNPESIHLLLASYPIAATKLDDAGRSASDLVHEGVQPEDRAVVLGSLARCIASQQQTEAEWSARLDQASKRHSDELDRLVRENRKRLAVKDLALAELAREVQAGSERLESASTEADEREAEIHRRTRAERSLAEQARAAEEEVSRLRSANRELKKRLGELDGTVMKHETTIERLNGRIDSLSNDLRSVCSMHDDLVRKDVRRVEQEMVKLIRLQKGFLNSVRDRGDDIRTILAESDVELPAPTAPTPVNSPPRAGTIRRTGSDVTGGSSGDDSSKGGSPGRRGRTSSSGSSGKDDAKSPFQRRHEPPSSAAECINEVGAAKRAAAMATVHLKNEKLISGPTTEQKRKQ